MLQVHHIIEESNGGESVFENAIALCINCHSEVHTARPFTQRFSKQELIDHRERVYRLIDDGSLIPVDEHEMFEICNVRSVPHTEKLTISDQASRVLVGAAQGTGLIMYIVSRGGCVLQAGDFQEKMDFGRKQAELECSLEELESHSFIKRTNSDRNPVWQMTHIGYQMADTIASYTASLV